MGILAAAPRWHFGDLYTVGLLAVGATVLVGLVATSRQHERTLSASVVYVVLGAAGAAALSLLDVAPLDPEADHVLLERVTELALIVAVFSAGSRSSAKSSGGHGGPSYCCSRL